MRTSARAASSVWCSCSSLSVIVSPMGDATAARYAPTGSPCRRRTSSSTRAARPAFRSDLLHSAKQTSIKSFSATPRCSSAVMPSSESRPASVLRTLVPRRKQARRAAPQEERRDHRQNRNGAFQLVLAHQFDDAPGLGYAEMIFVENDAARGTHHGGDQLRVAASTNPSLLSGKVSATRTIVPAPKLRQATSFARSTRDRPRSTARFRAASLHHRRPAAPGTAA